ncbi:hypothetical protein PAXRUDRAFT_150154, partial [Paxillus rubicundulus Ve08.2h10]
MPYLTQPHHLPIQPTPQTANHKAADTSDPNTMCTGMMKPAGMSYRPPNGSNTVKGKREKDQRDERASGSTAPSLDDKLGAQLPACMTNIVPDSTPPPSYPVNWRSPPQSMPPEGENCGEQLSSHVDETAMHLECPPHE